MTSQSKTANIFYTKVLVDETDQVVNLLLHNFFVTEPLGIALGLQKCEVSRWLPLYLKPALEQNASFGAFLPETKKLIGVTVNLINNGNGKDNLSMGSFIDPQKEPTMALLGRILGQLNSNVQRPNEPDRVFTCCFLNVVSKYGGLGIARELTLKAQEYALSLGINSFQVDTTSYFSFRVYEKVGYEILKCEKFAEFEENGKKILEGKDLGVHTHGRILYKVV